MLTKRPPVSIVIPHFEAIEFLPITLDSALAVASESDDIVIVDDGSSRGVFERVSALVKKDSRIRLLRHPENRGGGAARNTGVAHALHGWVFCLDSDNLMTRGLLDTLWQGAHRMQLDVAAPEFTVFFNGNPLSPTHAWAYEQRLVTLVDHVTTDLVPSASGNYLYTRESWDRAGGYPVESGALDAWGFGLRQVSSGARMQVIPNTFYLHRYGHSSYWVVNSSRRREMRAAALGLLAECSYQLPLTTRLELRIQSAVPSVLTRRVIPRMRFHSGGRPGSVIRPLTGRVTGVLDAAGAE